MRLVIDYLGRILQPAAVREHVRTDMASIDLTQLLDAPNIDVGNACRIDMAQLKDSEPDIEIKVNKCLQLFISFFSVLF